MSFGNDDVYVAPGAEAILNKAAKQPDPVEPVGIYFAAWRPTQAGLSPQVKLGNNVAIGETGQLTEQWKKTILADANVAFGRVPPAPTTNNDPPSYRSLLKQGMNLS